MLRQRCRTERRSQDVIEKSCGVFDSGVETSIAVPPSQIPSGGHLEVHVDSDWTGDAATCRNTCGVIVRRGRHLLRHSSKAQNVMALCCAESDYNALTRGRCSVLDLQSLFVDGNLKLQLPLHTDFSSGKTVASRRGADKSTRLIQTRML